MAMTLRLPKQVEAELRSLAEKEHRSLHGTVLLAVDRYLAEQETEQIKADPDALRRLAEAREAVRSGDVVYGTDAAKALVDERRDS